MVAMTLPSLQMRELLKCGEVKCPPQLSIGSLVPEAGLSTNTCTNRGILSFLMNVLEFVPLKKSLDLFYTPLVRVEFKYKIGFQSMSVLPQHVPNTPLPSHNWDSCVTYINTDTFSIGL